MYAVVVLKKNPTNTKAAFTADFFTQNRRRLRASVGEADVIVLSANGVLQRSNDTTFPFRQESNFWHLTGIEEPDCILVMDKDEEYLITPQRSEIHGIFEGVLNASDLRSVSGIAEVVPATEGWRRLRSRVRQLDTLATLIPPGAYLKGSGFYTNPARSKLIGRLRSYRSGISLVDVRHHFVNARIIKQPVEIAAIEQATAITAGSLNELCDNGLANYQHEFEIEAHITQGFGRHGAVHAYEPIVASGQNATTLHYVRNRAVLANNSFVLIDCGAEVSNYAADVTRTYMRGTVTKRQTAIYRAVRETQAYAFSLMKPGRSIKENEADIVQFIGEKLSSLELIDAPEAEQIRRYYPHALSHFVGLDVHDVGDYDRSLEPGMVITVEPGIYVPEEEVGVRIEDTILITDTGYKNLSSSCRYEP